MALRNANHIEHDKSNLLLPTCSVHSRETALKALRVEDFGPVMPGSHPNRDAASERNLSDATSQETWPTNENDSYKK